MAQAEDPPDELALQLAAIRARFVAGLPTRAKSLRATAESLASGKAEARDMARELVHRLAGVAGTHNLGALGDHARACEDAILDGAPSEEIVARLGTIADACDAAAVGSSPALRHTPNPPLVRPVLPEALRTEVLVVEDDPSTARWLCMALERVAQCTPRHVSSGTEARALLAARTFPLVILDGMLPGATGPELLAEIRAGERHQGTRVMMLSASHRRALAGIEQARADADAWLTKPVPLEVLAREVGRLLGRT